MKKPSEKVQIIHGQFVQYGKNAREWMRKCEMLLPHVNRERVWEKKGFGSIYEYAAKLAGMSRAKVDSVLWTLKKIEGKTEIFKVAEEKGVNAVRPIANIVTEENQTFWAEKARKMSMHTLEIYAKGLKNNGLLESKNGLTPCRATKKLMSMELEIEMIEELEKLKGNQDWNTLIKGLLEAHRELEKKEKQELEDTKPAIVRTNSRHIPAEIEKYVRARAKNRCEAPGCTRAGEHLHHTFSFALRKEHDPDKIRLLCEEHHDIAHHGLIENEEQSPENWKLREHANPWELRSVIDERVMKYKQGT